MVLQEIFGLKYLPQARNTHRDSHYTALLDPKAPCSYVVYTWALKEVYGNPFGPYPKAPGPSPQSPNLPQKAPNSFRSLRVSLYYIATWSLWVSNDVSSFDGAQMKREPNTLRMWMIFGCHLSHVSHFSSIFDLQMFSHA